MEKKNVGDIGERDRDLRNQEKGYSFGPGHSKRGSGLDIWTTGSLWVREDDSDFMLLGDYQAPAGSGLYMRPDSTLSWARSPWIYGN